MYADTAPCAACGAPVELRPHGDEPRSAPRPDDSTTDERVCTDPDCSSHSRAAGAT